MAIRAKIAAFKDVAGDAPDLRLALSDQDARALVAELGAGFKGRHSEALAAAAAEWAALPPCPIGDDDAVIAWANDCRRIKDAFWAALEGETVDGVTIIRRR